MTESCSQDQFLLSCILATFPVHLQALPLTCRVISMLNWSPTIGLQDSSKLTIGLELCLHVICVVGVHKTNFCFLTVYFSHLLHLQTLL